MVYQKKAVETEAGAGRAPAWMPQGMSIGGEPYHPR
jgi:hypothetical protein